MSISALVAEIEARVEGLSVRNTSALRALRCEYSKRIDTLPGTDVVKVAAALIARRRVHRFVGDELIASRPDALRTLDRVRLEQLGSSISSWDQVDSFACYLSGPVWRAGQIEDQTVMQWAAARNRWWRRAALVSTVPLNVQARGGQGDAQRTLKICGILIDDRDETVVKALSWALRALAKRDTGAVRQFVRRNEAWLPALLRREVQHKLATGRKNPRSP